MEHYYTLAIRYLQQNMRRTIVTILGVVLTAAVLYGGLNLAYCLLLQRRVELREEQDYELVLFTEDEDTIARIIDDPKVKSAYLGPYYSDRRNRGVYVPYHSLNGNEQEEALYPNALYINTVNPYRLRAMLHYMQQTYGVDGEYHEALAELYMQGENGSLTAVVILLTLLVAYIFSIIGVGIVRNGIHLSMLEQIRDYGNLRCIGSSKRQLKMIVYMQGFLEETIGVGLGTGLGVLCSRLFAYVFGGILIERVETSFHLLPMLVIYIMFLFDLYFIMDENVRLVMKMSPVAAIRGEYKLRNKREALKPGNRHFLRILNRIFGVDGVYAFQNVVRNPLRFVRTIGAMILSVAALIGIGAWIHSMYTGAFRALEEARYYQIYTCNVLDDNETTATVESSLPSAENLERLANDPAIAVAKRMYAASTCLPEDAARNIHYTGEYLATDSGRDEAEILSQVRDGNSSLNLNYLRSVSCFGYDTEDIRRCQPVLTAGTLDVSPQGVILVNRTEAYKENPYSHRENDQYDHFFMEYLDYQVGDTIRLMDIAELHRRLDGPLEELYRERYAALSEIAALGSEYNEQHHLEEYDIQGWFPDLTPKNAYYMEVEDAYRQRENALIAQVREQMESDDCYRTYVIEGIVSEDENLRYGFEGPTLRVIMPIETYCDLTGLDVSQPTGFMYHTDRLFPDVSELYYILYYESAKESVLDVDGWQHSISGSIRFLSDSYFETAWAARDHGKYLIAGVTAAAFLILMFALNTINTTASNLYLRRGELAQLRVIGVSKRHLMKMVMLEGLIQVVIADAVGMVIGGGLSYTVFFVLRVVWQIRYYYPVGMSVFCVILTLLIMCGSIYVPLRRMSNELSEDLRMGAE